MSIPITKPFFGEEERRAVLEPLESGWVVQGPFVERFERRFAEFVGAPFAVATSSCSTALHATVAALGLGPGDEVIVPGFTWVATANAVEHTGATPVFCDVDLGTFNLDPGAIEPLLTPKTVGILPVHLFGLCADIDRILAIADSHGLWVLEDAACALGGAVGERHAGTFGAGGCFSFHPRKSITTGEGGMLVTDREELAAKVRSLRDHGASRSDLARHEGKAGFLLSEYRDLGFNYRMTDLQGALGCAQMERVEWILAERAKRARRYDEMLGLPWLETPRAPEGAVHGYQSYVCLFRPEPPDLDKVERLGDRRDRLMTLLQERGIATRQGTHAAFHTDYYAQRYGLTPSDCPRSYLADRLSIALPLYPQMTDGDQDEVVGALSEVFGLV